MQTASGDVLPQIIADNVDGAVLLSIVGAWTMPNRDVVRRVTREAMGQRSNRSGPLRIDIDAVSRLDTFGAVALHRFLTEMRDRGADAELIGGGEHRSLLDRVAAGIEAGAEPPKPANPLILILDRQGRGLVAALRDAVALLSFLGQLVTTIILTLPTPWRFRWAAVVHHMERTGLAALPIVALLSFLIGIVLAYLSAGQLARFGAQLLVVNLLALSVFRELGVVLTSILIAGRSGSAYTAEIGMMQVNQEVDAMRTMGLDPMQVLVIPRVFALIITLPLLTFFADIAALAGGGVVAVLALDLTLAQYVGRLNTALTVGSVLVGLAKAPVFAVAIALVSCFQGLQVSGSAESVGRQTTKAVVQSIFLVIVLDAIFAVITDALGV